MKIDKMRRKIVLNIHAKLIFTASLQSYSMKAHLPVELHSRPLPSAEGLALCDENDGNHAPLKLDKLTHRRQ